MKSFLAFQTQHTFKHVFSDGCTQEQVFDRIAFPLVADLIQGKNGNNLYCLVKGGTKQTTFVQVCSLLMV